MKRKKSKIWILLVVLAIIALIIGLVLFLKFKPEKTSYDLSKLICENVSIEVGKSLVSNNTIYCNKVIEIVSDYCIGIFCTELESVKHCYYGSYKEDYPCDSSLCKFGNTVIVRNEIYNETIETWNQINKTVKNCAYNKTSEIIINDKNVKVSEKWLRDNCEYKESYDMWGDVTTGYWNCNITSGEYRVNVLNSNVNKETSIEVGFVEISSLNTDINSLIRPDDKEYFEKATSDFESDLEVRKIVDKCKNEDLKVECVYNSIPFKYDTIRAYTESGNLVLTPTYMASNDYYGVCRDISIFRMSILRSLGINAHFVIALGHIYVLAKEGNTIYELNNERITKTDKF
jgi:hypothetical protein